jgi:hypothetical protein
MSSLTIELKRKPNFTRLPDISAQQAKRKIGCTMTKSGAQRTGLTLEEVTRFMPEVLSLSTTDPGFRKAVSDYFYDLTVEVSDEGRKLEIGVTEDGTPLNLMDWIMYKFSIANPYVAENIEELHRDSRKLFYLHDRSLEITKKAAGNKEKAKAFKLLQETLNNPKKVITVLRVMGTNPSRVVYGLTEDKHEDALAVKLQELHDADPAAFMSAASNPHLDTVALIEQAISAEVIQKIGNAYYYKEEQIGSDLREATAMLEDKLNSGMVTQIKAQIKALGL